MELLGQFNELQLEFIIVTGAIISMILFFVISIVLLVGGRKIWKGSEATFNAGVVFLMLSIISLVVALLMWLFYPSYFTNIVQSMFGFGRFG